ncbi:MAG: outer membrane protein assembly factor BamB family protein [Planctomycetota bacterium]|jgi:outer membrane protein assembly factor BamB
MYTKRHFFIKKTTIRFITFMLMILVVTAGLNCREKPDDSIIEKINVTRGICVVLGDTRCELALDLASKTELLIYVQLQRAEDVELSRRAVDGTGLYGTRIYVEQGSLEKIHLADNIADVLIGVGDASAISEAEALRVLRPQAKALLGNKKLVKAFAEGADDWSHPYHSPDNNPQSNDQIVKAPYLTQFLADPRYAPVPQVTVASAGRVFKVFGHVAFKEREEPWLNTLAAFNGYNGTILWKKNLPAGLMVHRNTIIATPDTLYIADDKSCKLIDPATGRIKDEIKPSADSAGGTRWKWMAMEDGVLYALIGRQEQKDPVTRHRRTSHGWPWDKVSKGFNQPDGLDDGLKAYNNHPWGFGRNVLAIDPKTKKVLWNYQEAEPIDSRAMCMKNGRIYVYRFASYLACLDAETGNIIWRKNPENAPELFEALGTYLNRQLYTNNWRTTAYLKCSDKALYFAGSQMDKLLAVSAEDGTVLWQDPYDNYQLVFRDDGLYAFSYRREEGTSKKLDPLTGRVLAEFSMGRHNCTRPNGTVDAILYRAMGGSVRLDIASGRPEWISPMRPSCTDGVTIANGLLYWWPWACDCQLTLYGVTCLGPAGNFNFTTNATESERLEKFTEDLTNIATLDQSTADWPTFRANNTGTTATEAIAADRTSQLWQFKPKTAFTPTAPVAVGNLVFFSGSDGIVRVLDASKGKLRWKTYTGGAVRIAPTVWNGRVFVGSGDGWIYTLEAKTGRLLWRFQTAPEQRKIPVYNSLLSTWPAASGVLVEDGIAYVAAGIVNYDGTYVYALDAQTGQVKWQNNTSGHLDPQARTGVSVQGHLLLHNERLYMAGGTSLSPAVYDIKDGKCLNDPELLQVFESRSPRGWELFLVGDEVICCGKPFYAHPEYKVFDQSVYNKLLVASAGNKDITWINNSKIMCFNRIDKQLLNNCIAKPEEQDWFTFSWGKFDIPDKPLWDYDCGESVALAVCKNAVIVAKKSEVVAVSLNDGHILWSKPLSSSPVSWGLAVNRDGQIIVVLKDGSVLCFG